MNFHYLLFDARGKNHRMMVHPAGLPLRTGSEMLTSNLSFSEWERIFKDPVTTAAAIDRLVHHCIILELNLQSYRLEQSRIAKKEKTERGND